MGGLCHPSPALLGLARRHHPEIAPELLGEGALRKSHGEGSVLVLQGLHQSAQLLKPLLCAGGVCLDGVVVPAQLPELLLGGLVSGLHTESEVVLNVVLGILEASLERGREVGLRAQILDEFLDGRQGVPLLAFGGGDVLGDELDVRDGAALDADLELLTGCGLAALDDLRLQALVLELVSDAVVVHAAAPSCYVGYCPSAGTTRIRSVCLCRMTSSPVGASRTTSQFSGESPACPSRIFCFRVGFFPCRIVSPPSFISL